MGADGIRDLYRARQRAHAARNQLYRATTDAAFQNAVGKLVDAEQRLQQAEQAYAKTAPRPPPDGHRIKVSDAIDVDVQVLMPFVPTSTINLLPIEGPLDENAALVGYTVTSGAQDCMARLRFTSVVDGYSAPSVDTVAVSGDPVYQLPVFQLAPLKAVTELTAASLRVRVDVIEAGQEKLVDERTFKILLLARNTVYVGRVGADGQIVKNFDALAAFVTPAAIPVLEALRDAANDEPLPGYLTDAPTVEPQVRQIYYALRARNIAFIDSFDSFGSPTEFSQRVRLPSEVLTQRSANCVDASCLIASMLEASTINAGLVVVPGHVLVAWQQTGNDDWAYLESTMITTKHSFEEARDLGSRLVKQYGVNPGDVLSIEDLRLKGIYPLE